MLSFKTRICLHPWFQTQRMLIFNEEMRVAMLKKHMWVFSYLLISHPIICSSMHPSVAHLSLYPDGHLLTHSSTQAPSLPPPHPPPFPTCLILTFLPVFLPSHLFVKYVYFFLHQAFKLFWKMILVINDLDETEENPSDWTTHRTNTVNLFYVCGKHVSLSQCAH